MNKLFPAQCVQISSKIPRQLIAKFRQRKLWVLKIPFLPLHFSRANFTFWWKFFDKKYKNVGCAIAPTRRDSCHDVGSTVDCDVGDDDNYDSCEASGYRK